jgi:hypothetical protein
MCSASHKSYQHRRGRVPVHSDFECTAGGGALEDDLLQHQCLHASSGLHQTDVARSMSASFHSCSADRPTQTSFCPRSKLTLHVTHRMFSHTTENAGFLKTIRSPRAANYKETCIPTAYRMTIRRTLVISPVCARRGYCHPY